MGGAVRLALQAAADDPARVVALDPQDGASGVFRDALVVASLSHAIDPASLSAETFAVADDDGPVPGRAVASADGRCLVWRPGRLLVPGVCHRVEMAGLKDDRGRVLVPHRSRFVPCHLTYGDVFASMTR